jgi:hypothetical protein
MPYGLIPLIAAVFLTLRHLAITDASRRSKLAVATVVVASLAISRYAPQWGVLAMLLQVGASIYMLVYWKIEGNRWEGSA